jgi:transcriptional antiterminator RfaH
MLPAVGQESRSAWYCARTKPKNEHIAAANLKAQLGLEVFHPRLRSEQVTCRGVVKNVTEPVFPCYLFVRCVLEESMQQVRHVWGVSSLVHFGSRIPPVPDGIVAELQECFGETETLPLLDHPIVGDNVTVGSGVFFGMRAVVLRSWPAKRRVQILLDILGRPTPIEVHSSLVTLDSRPMSRVLPSLALTGVAPAVGI